MQTLLLSWLTGPMDAGLKEGIDEDELPARQIGLSNASQMSTTQEKYKERIKEKLLEVLHAAPHASLCSSSLVCLQTMSSAPQAVPLCTVVNDIAERAKSLYHHGIS